MSSMLTPVMLATLAAGLVTVITMLEVPPAPMLAGVKVLVTVGGAYTFTVWRVTPLVSKALMAVISAVVLVRAPAVTPRMVSVMVQLAPAATSMLVAVKGCVALTAVNAGVPQPALAGTAGLAICRPACKVSVKLRPLRNTLPVAVLAMVKTSVVVPLMATLAAPKALERVGFICTVRPLVVTALVTRAMPLMLALLLL